MKKILMGILLISLMGCSSKKDLNRDLEERENKDIQRDFVVIDASSPTRFGWIEDPEAWAHQNGRDLEKFRYFAFETEPKVSREIACDLAKAQVRSDIAGEIATFIDKQLGVSKEGDSSIDENNPNVKALREYTETTLAEKIMSLVHGAEISKTYWEKRRYQEKLGAKKDFTAYTCAVFIRMDSKRLATAVNEAANHVINKADDPETKENVKNALKNASENFIKAKAGEI